MAAKTGQKLDPNQELIGQGLANMIGSFGSSYSVSGSFSRSAVNLQAGALSGISSVVTSIMVVITLLFFTPPSVPSPTSSTGSGNHDGGDRTFKCEGFCSCLESSVVRWRNLCFNFCRHSLLCSTSRQRYHGRCCSIPWLSFSINLCDQLLPHFL